MTNLVLCGGAGTRLWPLSRKATPKQFCDLLEGPSLFERTLARNAPFSDAFLIVTSIDTHALAASQAWAVLGTRAASSFILEPVGRNTAPAIALGCLGLDREEVVLVTPSDHEIRDPEAYASAVARARGAAEAGNLVTFGLEPAYPETGYGYIKVGTALEGGAFALVEAFKEKPDLATAQGYLASKNYLWNSGMFCFKAGVFLDALALHSPAMLKAAVAARTAALAAGAASAASVEALALPRAAMEAIPADSIDYAVMERAERVVVVPCSIAWNDLGSWDSIHEIRTRDSSNNAGPPDLLALDARGNLVVGGTRRIVLVDVDDLIVVDTPDALLVTRRGKSQDVKKAVDALKAEGEAGRALL